MDQSIIEQLKAERARIDQAITILGGSPSGKRRGRPRRSVEDVPVQRKRSFSAATKRKMRESQKKRWAAARRAKAAKPTLVKKTKKAA